MVSRYAAIFSTVRVSGIAHRMWAAQGSKKEAGRVHTKALQVAGEPFRLELASRLVSRWRKRLQMW
jgi:hypothetical protein